MTGAAITDDDLLDPVGQFARDNRRMTRALHGGQLKRDHDFDDARRMIEISGGTPNDDA